MEVSFYILFYQVIYLFVWSFKFRISLAIKNKKKKVLIVAELPSAVKNFP